MGSLDKEAEPPMKYHDGSALGPLPVRGAFR